MWSKPNLMPDLYQNIVFSTENIPTMLFFFPDRNFTITRRQFCIWHYLLNTLEVFKCRPMALWYFNNMMPAYPKWFVDVSHISKIKMWYLKWEITFSLVTILLHVEIKLWISVTDILTIEKGIRLVKTKSLLVTTGVGFYCVVFISYNFIFYITSYSIKYKI